MASIYNVPPDDQEEILLVPASRICPLLFFPLREVPEIFPFKSQQIPKFRRKTSASIHHGILDEIDSSLPVATPIVCLSSGILPPMFFDFEPPIFSRIFNINLSDEIFLKTLPTVFNWNVAYKGFENMVYIFRRLVNGTIHQDLPLVKTAYMLILVNELCASPSGYIQALAWIKKALFELANSDMMQETQHAVRVVLYSASSIINYKMKRYDLVIMDYVSVRK
ncbi:hypothetical protein L9F63_023359, partial [Diploptera punctata]